MEKFLEVGEKIINIKDIRRVEVISDDIYLGLLPTVDGEIVGDFINFIFARIVTFDNREMNLSLDLYAPEEEETEEQWINKNRAYINMSMQQLYGAINPVKVTGMEY